MAAPSADSHERIRAVERVLGHTFRDHGLVIQAITHPSHSDQVDLREDYERLEFLGDSVLGLVVVDEIYRRFPELPEGTMTKIKIAVVAGATLSEVAEELGLADLIMVGESERGTGGRGMASALENAFEALVAAVYLDGGLEAAREVVLRALADRIVPGAADSLEHPKSLLQELLQSAGDIPRYEIIAVEGPPHDRTFTARVSTNGGELGIGEGRTKKEAEMNAASRALESLQPR